MPCTKALRGIRRRYLVADFVLMLFAVRAANKPFGAPTRPVPERAIVAQRSIADPANEAGIRVPTQVLRWAIGGPDHWNRPALSCRPHDAHYDVPHLLLYLSGSPKSFSITTVLM